MTLLNPSAWKDAACAASALLGVPGADSNQHQGRTLRIGSPSPIRPQTVGRRLTRSHRRSTETAVRCAIGTTQRISQESAHPALQCIVTITNANNSCPPRPSPQVTGSLLKRCLRGRIPWQHYIGESILIGTLPQAETQDRAVVTGLVARASTAHPRLLTESLRVRLSIARGCAALIRATDLSRTRHPANHNAMGKRVY